MAVQRFHQGQHGIKVVGADGEVELRYDSVCYVFLWNMGRRGQSGTVQQGTHDIFLWFTAPFASRQQGFQRAQQGDNAYDAEDIDGNTGYGAFHLVTVNGGGSSEYAGKVEVEYLFLLVGELHVDVAHRSGDGVQHFFPLCPPFQETGVIVCIRFVELVFPFFNGRHIVEQLAGEKPVFRRRDEGF